MHKKTLHPMYEAESGGAGGAPAPEGTKDPAGDDKAVFTPEQQAKIDELIGKAFAKGAAKAAKEAEEKAAREKQTEAERLAADRAALETEKAKLKAQALLSKSGYALGDDTDEAIAGLFAAVPDAAEDNIAALKKLIDAKVKEEVDKRLKGAGQPAPKSGDNDVTVGDAINGLFRNHK